MPLANWLAFAAASVIMLAIPGPTILLIVSHALSHGRKAATATVAGVVLGDFSAMTASLLGLGAVVAASAGLFGLLRLIGAAYLVYLGIRLWRAPVVAAELAPDSGRDNRAMLLHAFAVTALNPKSIVFFVAFLPQFLSDATPVWSQLIILEATFLTLSLVNASIYALLASGARETIRRPSVQRVVNRTGGGLLIGSGVLAAVWRGARG